MEACDTISFRVVHFRESLTGQHIDSAIPLLKDVYPGVQKAVVAILRYVHPQELLKHLPPLGTVAANPNHKAAMDHVKSHIHCRFVAWVVVCSQIMPSDVFTFLLCALVGYECV